MIHAEGNAHLSPRKTGLIGLVGLLGLAGLAGLKRRNDYSTRRDTTSGAPGVR